MGAIASQIISLTMVYSIVYSGSDQRKHQSPASLAFVMGIHRGPVNSPHKGPVTRKIFPFDDVIMKSCEFNCKLYNHSKTKQSKTRTTRTPAFWDTPAAPWLPTHTRDSHHIPSQKKTKSNLQILKNCQNFKFLNFARNFARHTPSEFAL